MNYKWDENKAKDNICKHGVDFADAVVSLEDENALTIEDKDHQEQRFNTLGSKFSTTPCNRRLG